MAQVRRRGGIPGWAAAACVAVSCVAGAGAHALVADPGVQIERADDSAAGEGAAAEVPVPEPQDAREEVPCVVVHVDGAVAAPGVYELAVEGARVADAVEAAGGLADGADLTFVNLAALVADGEKIHVPLEGEEVSALGAVPSPGSSVASQDGTVNINTATAEELMALPGIGEATAAAIVEDRERLGPFESPEDLMRVSGIGEKKLERVRDRIRV